MMQTEKRNLSNDQWVQSSKGLWLPKQFQEQQRLPELLITSSNKIPKKPWMEKLIAGKSLWEWISLLLVPLLVGVGTIWVVNQQTTLQIALSIQQHRCDQEIAQEARWDDILKAYRDGIDTLILSNGLKQSRQGDNVRMVAQSRTLDVLRQVDRSRKEAIIAYLADLGLVQGGYFSLGRGWNGKEPIISLYGVDLRFAHEMRNEVLTRRKQG